jgi:predicted dehydrogenase
MKKLRVGVIGVGYLGEFHAQKYFELDHVDLVGIVDIDKDKARKIAKRFSTHPYVNHEDLIGKVDAVSVVVPTPDHFRISSAFLQNKVDVLIEKPMTVSLEEADELIRLAKMNGLIIQVGHLERFNPAVVALRNIVENPRFIESHRLSIYQPRGSDVSVVLDLMIHDIDIISNFVNSDIKRIHAAGIPVISNNVDIANARLEFENGAVANVTASRIATHNERKIRLFQKQTYVSVDFANQGITLIKKNGGDQASVIPGTRIQSICIEKRDALKDEIISFIKAVKERKAPEVTGQVGRDALKIALSIMEQINQTLTTNIRHLR